MMVSYIINVWEVKEATGGWAYAKTRRGSVGQGRFNLVQKGLYAGLMAAVG